MALVVKDRVRETTTTAGTGTVTLAGAVAGFQSFAVIGNSNTTFYCIVDTITGEWEVGIGTYTSSGTTLSRDTILESSTGGTAVSFAGNTKDVFVTYPAERSVYSDAAGTTVNVTNLNATTVDTTNIEVTNIKAKDGTASASIADSTGVMTVTNLTGTTADYTNIEVTNIKAKDGTASASIADSTGVMTVTNLTGTTADYTNIEVTNIKAKDGTAAASIADSTGKITVSTELAVDNLNLSGNTISSTDANGNIVLAPNGTGDVQVDADTLRVGDSNANATITTNGTGDLILNTNAGTNSSSITIQDAANGNIILAPTGTGRVQVSGTTSNSGGIELFEDTDNGTNKALLTAPAALGADITVTLPDITSTLGYRNIPPVGTKTGSYTLATTDVGEYVQVSTGGSITIPDATFAEGDAVSIFNNTSGNITITCTITTAYIAGTDSDKASVTLATRGVATILFISSTVCVITGNVS